MDQDDIPSRQAEIERGTESLGWDAVKQPTPTRIDRLLTQGTKLGRQRIETAIDTMNYAGEQSDKTGVRLPRSFRHLKGE